MRQPAGRRPRRLIALLGVWAGMLAVLAGGVRAETLRVGTSGDYPPFSAWSGAPDEPPAGFDPELARAYAQNRGIGLQFVRFAWPDLAADLEAGRFDLAVGGITIRPERSLAGRFSVPIATSGAVVLVGAASPVRTIADLAGLRVGVNAGGHLERVARQRLAGARVRAIPDNAGVLPALRGRDVDAVVTDTLEAPHWQRAQPGLRAIGPFTRDRKAWWIRLDRPELAADVDAWLTAREADGTLARLRARHLGEMAARDRPAAPLPALLAAIDERLALMPAVAEAKRASGAAVEAPEREAAVLDAAVASARRSVETSGTGAASGPLDPERARAVRALFRAQIEAAKSIQREVLARPAAADAVRSDLTADLRPALIRIGDRIVQLALALPADPDPATVRELTRRELDTHGLARDDLDALADAISALARSAPAPAPDQ